MRGDTQKFVMKRPFDVIRRHIISMSEGRGKHVRLLPQPVVTDERPNQHLLGVPIDDQKTALMKPFDGLLNDLDRRVVGQFRPPSRGQRKHAGVVH
ncbi:hypothetical protein C1M55_11575 [Rhodococcus qingshengii]|nr:hypothetical protein C1M55_11575 [Rhodococcus qingshengii]OMQ36732.1 hypothetical protein BK799_09050 [Rhodococcus sp. D-1]